MPSSPSSAAVLRRALLALAVVGLALWTVLTTSPRLGLDLRGGTGSSWRRRTPPGVRADAEATDRTLEVLRKRVDGLGVAEPSLARSGENRIIVELPGLRDPREAAESSAAPPSSPSTPSPARPADRRSRPPPTAPGSSPTPTPPRAPRFLVLAAPALTGDGVKSADAVLDTTSGAGWTVDLAFRDDAADDWARLTGEAACAARRPLPAGRDRPRRTDRLRPRHAVRRGLRQRIVGGATQITGGFSAQEARDLAALVEGGALPVPVTTIEQSTVGPTLARRGHPRQRPRRRHRPRLHRCLRHRRLPAPRPPRHRRPAPLRADLVRGRRRARRHPHPPRPRRASSSRSASPSTPTSSSSNGPGRSTRPSAAPPPLAIRAARSPPPSARRGAPSPTPTSPPSSPPASSSPSPPAP